MAVPSRRSTPPWPSGSRPVIVGVMSVNWRNPRTWQVLGIIATGIWLSYVGMSTGFDPTHPLFDYIFIVPIAGWLPVIFIIRRLERSAAPSGSEPPAT